MINNWTQYEDYRLRLLAIERECDEIIPMIKPWSSKVDDFQALNDEADAISSAMRGFVELQQAKSRIRFLNGMV